MAKVTRETEKYKHIVLYETDTTRIKLVEDKKDRAYDKICFTKFGNEYYEPESISVFRYEDEQLIEDMKERYGAE